MSLRSGSSRSNRIALPNTTLAAAAVYTVSMISDEIKPAMLACFLLPHSRCPGPVAKTHYRGQQTPNIRKQTHTLSCQQLLIPGITQRIYRVGHEVSRASFNSAQVGHGNLADICAKKSKKKHEQERSY